MSYHIHAFADEAGQMLSAQIVAMQRNKLEGLEIRNINGKNVVQLTDKEAKDIRRQMDDAGLCVWSIGSPLGKIMIGDEFAPHLDTFRRTLDIADILGARRLRMFSFFMPQGETNIAQYRDEVFARLSQMVEAAKGSNIVLCHENEKGIYGDMAARCLEIHQAFPALKCVFDPANFVQCGQDTLEAWAMLKPYIEYLHIKDAMPDMSVVPAGEGVGHVKEILADYVAVGGRDMTIEPHLNIFDGLQGLEREGDRTIVGKYEYPSSDAAFDAACSALYGILPVI